MLDIYCEICREKVATAEESVLVQPIRGSMFKSPDAWHGIPDPFPPDVDWEFMQCPFCRNRPFIDPTAVIIHVAGTEFPKVFKRFEIPENKPTMTISIEQDADEEVENPLPLSEINTKILTCEVCGRQVKGVGPLASHMRSHRGN
jgi:hypothetical protein